MEEFKFHLTKQEEKVKRIIITVSLMFVGQGVLGAELDQLILDNNITVVKDSRYEGLDFHIHNDETLPIATKVVKWLLAEVEKNKLANDLLNRRLKKGG